MRSTDFGHQLVGEHAGSGKQGGGQSPGTLQEVCFAATKRGGTCGFFFGGHPSIGKSM